VKGFASFAPHWASIVIMKTSLTIKNVDIKFSEFDPFPEQPSSDTLKVGVRLKYDTHIGMSCL